ncbi:MAG: FAD-dependent thymidylate synthase [Campylobacterales bacterium]|nr:FAD-dependent thymidylate synthase [Campylobacterales bacterium]
MNIELLQHSNLEVCAHAIRTCWQSFDKSDNGGEKDKELINRVGNKFKHASTLEHLTYTFYISGVSRALLQELARHRMASPSVKSTRYTLKELKNEDSFTLGMSMLELREKYTNSDEVYADTHMIRANKYLVFTGNLSVDFASVIALENLRIILIDGIANDIAKYCLPESYKTELTWTINARSLQNFLYLRSSKSALWEIRDLAKALYETLPEDHKYLFEDCINSDTH